MLQRTFKSQAGYNKGITLVEIMVTTMILTIGLVGVLAYLVTTVSATEMARDSTVAVTHAEYVMEDMTSRTTLAAITAQNWASFATSNGLNTLPGENITVSFLDTAADPLHATVNVAWTRKSRTNNVRLQTEITK